MLFGIFTLFVALVIEIVGAYYSVTGLAAIFSGAIMPIIIMGGALEVGKVTAAVWLKMNWERASWAYKFYLVPAVAFMMILTSMGIFGFLSKAHSDQGLVSGDSMAKVAIYDEKIKTAKDNIDTNRKALKQMDEAVDQVMARSDDEKGADKAVAIRRSQQKERGRLLAEIEVEQRKVAGLSEERAPFAAEFRKVESEVGPIKYIAALLYGDNPDANILERAVRWVIILIVAVFDPLALVLILAAQQSIRWAKEDAENKPKETLPPTVKPIEESNSPQDDEPINEIIDVESNDVNETVTERSADPHPVGWMYNSDTGAFEETITPEPEKTLAETHPYLFKPFSHFTGTTPIVHKPEIYSGNPEEFKDPWAPGEHERLVKSMQEFFDKNKDEEVNEVKAEIIEPDLSVYDDERLVSNFDKQVLAEEPKILAMGIDDIERPGDYITPPEEPVVVRSKFPKVPETAHRVKAEAEPVPETVHREKAPSALQADNVVGVETHSGFGTKFPDSANKGDTFLRVDHLPNKLFKYNGFKWIEVDKSKSDAYAYDEQYILFLIEKLRSGEYEIDQLSDSEQELVAEKLQQLSNDNT